MYCSNAFHSNTLFCAPHLTPLQLVESFSSLFYVLMWKLKAAWNRKLGNWIKDNLDAVGRYSIISPCYGRVLPADVSLAMDLNSYPLTLHCALYKSKQTKNKIRKFINISWVRKMLHGSLPKYASCFGMYSCISDSSFAISWESFVMLHSSSAWKSGFNCLHIRSWLITFPRLLGPTADPSSGQIVREGLKPVIYSALYLFIHIHAYRNTQTYPSEQFSEGDTSVLIPAEIVVLDKRAILNVDYLKWA